MLRPFEAEVAQQVARQLVEQGPFLLIAFPHDSATGAIVEFGLDDFYRTRLKYEYNLWRAHRSLEQL